MNRFLFVGLGNPGDQYQNTRHNAGWMALDLLVQKWRDPTKVPQWKLEKKVEAEVLKLNFLQNEIIFLKPQTFMNDSGRSVAAAVKWYLDEDPTLGQDQPHVVVFHDDLDIEIGRYKLQFNSGPKVHNGVNNVRDHLHTTAFWTARFGVDSRQGDRSIPGKAYVLQRLPAPEQALFAQAVRLFTEELPYTVLK